MKVELGKYEGSKEVDFVKITDSNGVKWRIDCEMNGIQVTIPGEQVMAGNVLAVGRATENLVRIELHDQDAWTKFNQKLKKGRTKVSPPISLTMQ